MLRIGMPNTTPPAPPEEQAPPEMPDQGMPQEAMMPESGGGLVDPQSARYFGPESRCASCLHFMDPGSCEIVSGPIDPAGICMLFMADQQMPMEAPVEEPAAIPPTGDDQE